MGGLYNFVLEFLWFVCGVSLDLRWLFGFSYLLGCGLAFGFCVFGFFGIWILIDVLLEVCCFGNREVLCLGA